MHNYYTELCRQLKGQLKREILYVSIYIIWYAVAISICVQKQTFINGLWIATCFLGWQICGIIIVQILKHIKNPIISGIFIILMIGCMLFALIECVKIAAYKVAVIILIIFAPKILFDAINTGTFALSFVILYRKFCRYDPELTNAYMELVHADNIGTADNNIKSHTNDQSIDSRIAYLESIFKNGLDVDEENLYKAFDQMHNAVSHTEKETAYFDFLSELGARSKMKNIQQREMISEDTE